MSEGFRWDGHLGMTECNSHARSCLPRVRVLPSLETLSKAALWSCAATLDLRVCVYVAAWPATTATYIGYVFMCCVCTTK